MSVPEGNAIIDCGAAVGCFGKVAAALTAGAIAATGQQRILILEAKTQHFILIWR